MVINDVPKITDHTRDSLSTIFENQFNEIADNINHLLTYPVGAYAHEFHGYNNVFRHGFNNLIKNHDGSNMMSVFNFNLRNIVKIYKILQIEKFRPTISGIRVFSGATVPMHIDANKGNIGRENPIYSIVVSGSDGIVFMSNKKDGSRLAAVPGKTEFILCPTLIEHGAKAGVENYDILQIQLSAML